MKRLSFLKSRRGVAIESAIFTLVMVFSLCSIIITVSLYLKQGEKKETDAFREQILVDQIGEDFLFAVQSGANYQKDADLTDGVDNSLLVGEDRVLFDPHSYDSKFNNDEKKLLLSFSAPTAASKEGQYVLTLKKDTTFVTEAVKDEEGNIIRDESTTVVTSHLLTIVVRAKVVDGILTYELLQWSYLD